MDSNTNNIESMLMAGLICHMGPTIFIQKRIHHAMIDIHILIYVNGISNSYWIKFNCQLYPSNAKRNAHAWPIF